MYQLLIQLPNQHTQKISFHKLFPFWTICSTIGLLIALPNLGTKQPSREKQTISHQKFSCFTIKCIQQKRNQRRQRIHIAPTSRQRAYQTQLQRKTGSIGGNLLSQYRADTSKYYMKVVLSIAKGYAACQSLNTCLPQTCLQFKIGQTPAFHSITMALVAADLSVFQSYLPIQQPSSNKFNQQIINYWTYHRLNNNQQIMNHSEVRLQPAGDFQIQTPESLKQFDESSGFNQNRVIGIAILLLLFGAFWVYGWTAEITLVLVSSQPSNWTSQTIYGSLVILSALFTVVGYGLLFTYYKNSIAISFFVSIFVVSFTVIASPLIQKFWFNVFISDFVGNTFSSNDGPQRFFYYTYDGWNVSLDFYNMKVTMANCISQLVVYLAIFGKLTIPQIVINTLFYNILWNLNYFLCALLQINSPDTRVFDDYQISHVYLFASSYSLILSLILKKPSIKQSMKNHSLSLMALSGTFFIWMSFCTTTTLFPLKFTPGQAQYARSYIWQQAYISSFFALSASVIFTFAFSIIFGNKIGLKQAVFGTISGGIIYGSVAGTCINIGTSIACGLFAGLFSAFFFRYVYNKINKSSLFDSYGGVNVLLISLIGTFGIAPIVLIAYYDRHWILTTLEVSNFDKVGLPLINSSIAGWVLIYVGISVGIGAVSGLIIALLLHIIRNRSIYGLYNYDLFTLQYGLTQGNLQIFEDELAFNTNFEKVIKVLRKHNLHNHSSYQEASLIQIKRKENGLQSVFMKSKSKVEVSPQVNDQQFGKLAKALGQNQVIKNNSVANFHSPNRDNSQRSANFKTLYHLCKTKKLERQLQDSSLVQLKVDLIQNWQVGKQEKHAKVKGVFEREDGGVAYLKALKKIYPQLELGLDIKSDK